MKRHVAEVLTRLAEQHGPVETSAQREALLTLWLEHVTARDTTELRRVLQRLVRRRVFDAALLADELPPARVLRWPLGSSSVVTRFGLPAFEGAADVAAWAGLDVGRLVWLENRGGRARHYRVRWVPKRRGRRLLEAPRPALADLQRMLARDLFRRVPTHPAAHGFVRGRCPRTHAALHAAKDWVVRVDLADFFPSITGARVRGLFRAFGWPAAVAALLTRLTTRATSAEELGACTPRERRYAEPHLPQGAPSSPALANAIAYRLDVRLSALAERLGATYSRYADDLVLSGDRRVRDVAPKVGAIAMEEGFEVAFRKTRVMHRSQRQETTGLVVNVHPNVHRRARKKLEAILCNCARHGWRSQDREGHGARFHDVLRGRIAHVAHTNPAAARRLRRWFERIDWD